MKPAKLASCLLPLVLVAASCSSSGQTEVSPHAQEPIKAAKTTSAPAQASTDGVSPTPIPQFELRAGDTLKFQHVAGRSPEKYLPETMGGGVVISDFNRDGAPDVLFINSGTLAQSNNSSTLDHALFINDGRGEFENRTSSYQLDHQGYCMGAAVGDIDNDGFPDLYVTTFDGKDRLLCNDGDRFEDITQAAGLHEQSGWSTSASFFDMERDGDLDLYVVKYIEYAVETAIPCFFQGTQLYCTPVMFEPQADLLFRNNGDGTFTEVSKSAGIPAHGKGLALGIVDIDRDGDSDIYIANDTTANFLLVNDGEGTFVDRAGQWGVGYDNFGKEEAGMGVDFSDINGDGRVDIACTNFQGETTSVYVQQPQGYFLERSDALGVGKTAPTIELWHRLF